MYMLYVYKLRDANSHCNPKFCGSLFMDRLISKLDVHFIIVWWIQYIHGFKNIRAYIKVAKGEKVSQFTEFHPKVAKTSTVFASFVWKVLKKTIA